MRIGLVDVDSHNYPNLCLMKLSAWHKQQANARLHRHGQERPVIVQHLVAEGTVDEQVMAALEKKDMSQAALMAALAERRAAKSRFLDIAVGRRARRSWDAS